MKVHKNHKFWKRNIWRNLKKENNIKMSESSSKPPSPQIPEELLSMDYESYCPPIDTFNMLPTMVQMHSENNDVSDWFCGKFLVQNFNGFSFPYFFKIVTNKFSTSTKILGVDWFWTAKYIWIQPDHWPATNQSWIDRTTSTCPAE